MQTLVKGFSMLNWLYKLQGRYVVNGTFRGKTRYNLIANRADKLYMETLDWTLDELMESWGRFTAKTTTERFMDEFLMAYDIDPQYKGIASLLAATCYQHVVAKRYKDEYGVDLTGGNLRD